MSYAPRSTRYEIMKEALFDTNLSDGTHTRTLDDGIRVEAYVEAGQIKGYTAFAPSGKPLPVRRLRLTRATEATHSEAECMYCICGETTCRCWKEPCLQ
jgi:hypothetical protein